MQKTHINYIIIVLQFKNCTCLHILRSRPNNEPWEIAPEQIEILEEIGQGAFGKVFRGQMDVLTTNKTSSNKAGQTSINPNNCFVAVKMLRCK